jgi:hydrogenase maturation protease
VSGFWEELGRRGAGRATVDGVEIAKGSRVRLRPRQGGDIFDLALAGRTAVVEAVEEDAEGELHVAVTLDDDPGRDLGDARFPAHRFFFRVEEVEPVEEQDPEERLEPRILVAGIGNVFLGDDGFGVAVARRLARRDLPPGVEASDFGIRGMDLAYALQADYDAVVFVDTAPRGELPGTISVVEPELDPGEVTIDTHGMDPVRVLGLARALGRVPPRVLVVACEPERIVRGEHDEDLVGELSAPVRAAVDEAVGVVESLVADLAAECRRHERVVADEVAVRGARTGGARDVPEE